MSEVHIFTVGASLILNLSRRVEEFREWLRTPPEDARQETYKEQAVPGNPLFDEALKSLEADPRGYSAELNAFYGFMDLRKKPLGEAKVVLLSTDTGVGWFCSQALHCYLTKIGVPAETPRKIVGFGLGPEFFDKGLVNLLDEIAGIVRSAKGEGKRVYINATGGFKPESAFAVMSAFFFGADAAYYIHELFKEVVVLYPFPSTIESELVNNLIALEGKAPSDVGLIHHDKLGTLSLEDLQDRGLVSVREGRVELRDWVKVLIKRFKA